MSAYSASLPVSARNTAPRIASASSGCCASIATAKVGDTATRTPGFSRSAASPSTASVANHSSITGPNIAPTRSAPRLCTRNSAARMTSVTGTIAWSADGFSSVRPSTALITDIAGVISASQ
jgi:hypothetical protein